MIEITSVHRHFAVGDQTVRALDDVSLRITRGEYVSVMGPSGSGKSTLLNILGLLDRPTAGRYLLDGKDTTEMNESALALARRADIGFVFQFFHLVPRLTAEQNVELPLVLAGTSRSARLPRVRELLRAYGLGDRMHHRPDQLSGGQRQRAAIARATVTRPRVLLADEPTGNLDRASSHDIVSVLEKLNADGLTLIVVTHDPEIGGRARRKIRMADGRIVEDQR